MGIWTYHILSKFSKATRNKVFATCQRLWKYKVTARNGKKTAIEGEKDGKPTDYPVPPTDYGEEPTDYQA